jgi:hypothetical protein
MKTLINKNKYPIALIIISLILCAANYQPGTILSGWDTLHPEFNFWDYFSRIIFGVWQQHQGLGALATQAHASEIARMFIYFPMSIFLPENLLRYSYFFLTLILGPLGTYLFLKHIVFKENSFQNQIASFSGGLFYLLNLAILQQFYVPFEMFATHFASLGFIFLFALKYIEEKSRKYLILYSVTIFLSASMAHTSTLWFAFFGIFSLFLLLYSFVKKNKAIFKTSISLLILTIVINSFWLLPNIYFLLTEGSLISQAKITSLFSPEAFAQNAAYGTIPDLLLFKNFLFSWGQYVDNNQFGLLLPQWIDHLNNPFILFLGYSYSFIALLGVIYSIFKKNKLAIAFLSILSICVFFWLNINPPVGFLFTFFQDKIPFFREAVRFPFTKFSIMLVFSFSFYFAFGLSFLIELSNKIKIKRLFSPVLLLIVLVSLIIYMLPAFQGYFIDPSMRTKIPKEYFSMFSWFNKQPQGRVAELPIQSFWGWQYYSWGYQGAGFLWFGIKQPLLDREFDRWNSYNEQYYREMSQAVYTQNENLFKQVVKKYDIQYVLVDKNVIAPGPGANPKVLFFKQIDELLRNDSDFNKINRFGNNLFVYSETGSQVNYNSDNWVYLLKSPPSVAPYTKAYYEDFAYEKYSDYIEGDNGVFFPFRNILDNQNRILSTVNSQNNGLIFTFNSQNKNLSYQNLLDLENSIPADVTVEKNSSTLNVKLYPNFPLEETKTSPLPIQTQTNIPLTGSVILSLNQTQNYVLNGLPDNTPLAVDKVFLNTKSDNSIVIYPSQEDFKISPDFSILKYSLGLCGASRANTVFGINNINNNSFSLSAKNSQICMTIPIMNIFPNIKQQFSNATKELLMSLSVQYRGDNSSSICIAKLDSAGCLYSVSKNLILNASNSQGIQQYVGITQDNVNNLGIRISFNAVDSDTLKKVSYSNLNIGFTKPIATTTIKSDLLNASLANLSVNKSDNYHILVPFTGIQDLSKDITILPRVTGDCPSQNSRGENPANAQVIKTEIGHYIRYSSEDGSFCDHFSYQNLPHNQSYVISITSRNLQGLPIRLCVTNDSSTHCDIYTDLSPSSSFKQENFLLPPMGQGDGYDIGINNFAVKGTPSINDLKSISIIPLPYTWMSQIKTTDQIPPNQSSKRLAPESVLHPNQSLYLVKVYGNSIQTDKNILVLSQSYENGWAAYSVNSFGLLEKILPFLVGKRLQNHISVNDWSNGWTIEPDTRMVVIVYLPQYLEYLGFIILIMPVLVVLLRFLASKRLRKRAPMVDL